MARPDPVDVVAAQQIAGIECASAGIAATRVIGPERGEAVAAVRDRISFRIWTECLSFSLKDVARAVGRSDHSTAIHAILNGAKAEGRTVARVSDLREPRADDLDWTKLAYAAAAWRSEFDLTLKEAGRRSGVGGPEWRKVEKGRAVSPGTLLRICRTIGFQPFLLLPGKPGGATPLSSSPSSVVSGKPLSEGSSLTGAPDRAERDQSSTAVSRVTEASHAAG